MQQFILKIVSKLIFGGAIVDSKIRQLNAFTVVGKKYTVSISNGENLQEIPKFWLEANEADGISSHLLALNNGEIEGMMGISIQKDPTETEMDYWIAVPSTHTSERTYLEIPASKWLQFELVGAMPEVMQKAFQTIFTEIIPANKWEIALPLQIEYYPPTFTGKDEDTCEIWIPIK